MNYESEPTHSRRLSYQSAISLHTPKRSRGITIVEIILAIIIGLGVIVGGLSFYRQAKFSAEVTHQMNVIMSLAAEVRSQAATLPTFGHLPAHQAIDPHNASVEGNGDKTSSVLSRTSLPATYFDDLVITGSRNNFALLFFAMNEDVCKKMLVTDLGNPKTVSQNCEDNFLSVMYTKW